MNYRLKMLELGLSRKIVAQNCGLTYAAFSARMSGFTPWQPGEEAKLQAIINAAEQAQQAARDDLVEATGTTCH